MSATINASRWRVSFTADAPLHHGAFGADTGNAVALRRLPLASAPRRAGVPCLSGGSLRGALRRIVMRDLFEVCGLSRATPELGPQGWDRLYAALANGGHLTGSETRVVPEARRALRAVVPAASVFGAALYSWMLAGHVSSGWVWPRSRETVAAGLCTPGDGDPSAERDVDDLTTEIGLVRHIEREHQDPDVSGVTPMPVTVEAFIPGVVFESEFVALVRLPEVERACLAWGLDRLVVLGGKGAAGFGRVTVAHSLDATAYEAWRADPAAVANARTALVALATTGAPAA